MLLHEFVIRIWVRYIAKSGRAEFLELLFWTGDLEILAKTLMVECWEEVTIISTKDYSLAAHVPHTLHQGSAAVIPDTLHQGSVAVIPHTLHQGSVAVIPHTLHQGFVAVIPHTLHQGFVAVIPHTPHQCSDAFKPPILNHGSDVVIKHAL